MRLIRKLEDLPEQLRRGAVSIGNFDGVHLGHAHLIERLVIRAHEHGGPALVFTFDPHPSAVLRPEKAPPSLSWTQRKVEILGRLGVDMVVAFRGDSALFQLQPTEFFELIVLGHLESRAIVEGPNFFFGRGRRGDIKMLEELCRRRRLTLEVVEPVIIEGEIVSSSRIRKLIAAGEIDKANRLLTEPYRIRGGVVPGEGRGARLGFPTINLEEIDTLLPGEGIYAARAYGEGRDWAAAVNIGPSRTFDDDRFKVEAHLIGAEGDFYGARFELEFLARIRGLQKFESPDRLVAQIERDVASTLKIVEQIGVRYE